MRRRAWRCGPRCRRRCPRPGCRPASGPKLCPFSTSPQVAGQGRGIAEILPGVLRGEGQLVSLRQSEKRHVTIIALELLIRTGESLAKANSTPRRAEAELRAIRRATVIVRPVRHGAPTAGEQKSAGSPLGPITGHLAVLAQARTRHGNSPFGGRDHAVAARVVGVLSQDLDAPGTNRSRKVASLVVRG